MKDSCRWAKSVEPTFANPRGYPPEVSWIEMQSTEKRVKTQPMEPPLSEEEVLAILRSAQNKRDRACIFVHYESLCRIGDDRALKWKDFEF